MHTVVAYLRQVDLRPSGATGLKGVPYQAIDGVGERDPQERWEAFQPSVDGKRVLDLGCNLGFFSARALAAGATSVEGYDRDAVVLESAVTLHPELDGSLAVMDLNKTVPEGEYDVAFCLSVYQHLEPAARERVLQLLKTVPVIYWEDSVLDAKGLKAQGFEVELLGRSERVRDLCKLTSPALEVANA